MQGLQAMDTHFVHAIILFHARTALGCVNCVCAGGVMMENFCHDHFRTLTASLSCVSYRMLYITRHYDVNIPFIRQSYRLLQVKQKDLVSLYHAYKRKFQQCYPAPNVVKMKSILQFGQRMINTEPCYTHVKC